MEFIEVKGKTVEEAITNAQLQLGITSAQMEYEIIERESNGFLGLIGKKDAVIKARKKSNLIDDTLEFLDKMFAAMNMEVKSTIDYNEENRTMNIDFASVAKALKDINYSGYLTLECDAYIKSPEDIEAKVKNLCESVKKLDNIISEA